VLNRSNAEEFLEVYKGVVTDYAEMLNEITSGPVVALEVCQIMSFATLVIVY
jgi:nucleoside-diphosphate kinase